ncbi:cytochrome c oxidase subunit 1 [Halarchaeum rubridurum]|uniref:Cytochrome c oxidase subunit 1 n=1 Tax=Halarchaeum rubridurum TaxID=489911 RepID=A0A830FXX4_9EURY|nr:b(o/a)3-type cytochrome-c oxidase subunit 1 [Halarchaeum rubridurum]MBP1954732.1 cytochrome c oxidase subunit 1 [Halarchaeum rubridurum]GGM63417.1 cytochrome c oxidase subunit I [Halarchaeum rubridurum]
MTYVDDFPGEARVVRTAFAVAFASIGLGGALGVLQALFRTGYSRSLFSAVDYYSVLTAHGVLMALVFTTFFIVGLFAWGVTRSLDTGFRDLRFTWGWLALMTLGTLLAFVSILGGIVGFIPTHAAVLYTFYAPLEASPTFYLGLALLVVGSWGAGVDYVLTLRDWRADNPDERIPLQTFMAVSTMLLWFVCTLGVAVEVVVFLLPWSLGLIPRVDPLLTRTLFWYFGHAVVYFWLLPAYFVWYTIFPKLSGGRLFSDPLARVVFVLFLVLSTPVGVHHQYGDPGLSQGLKFVQMTSTYFILLPSLLTAFTVVASMEHGARQRGGEGRFGWLRALPWENPSFSGIALAGLAFAASGFGGMVNAGLNVNALVHNTMWVPGHFHLTVGTAVALTFMAITYWLLPQLTGKRLRLRTLAAVQPYLWFVGMVFMSNAMHRIGLAGVPRRTSEPQYEQVIFNTPIASIGELHLQTVGGAFLLFASLLCFLAVVGSTWLGERGAKPLAVNGHIPSALSGPEHSPRVLDDFRVWVALTVLLLLIAYGPPLAAMVQNGLFAPGSAPIPA